MQKKFRIEVTPTHVDQNIINKLQLRLIENINDSSSSLEVFNTILAEITGSNEVLAVSSGTAALHLSLLALGIKEGDYIACATFTFVATVNAIYYNNANPVFIDSEKESWNMCPQLLEQAIKEGIKNGRKIKAVIVVHAYGVPAKIDQIMSICNGYEIPVVEDAASALGSKYNNQNLGTFGAIGILSFNYNKIITTTGGGALLTQKLELKNRAAYYANQAKSTGENTEHHEVGFNYKMSGMNAELGIAQFSILQEYIHIKRRIFAKYMAALNNSESVRFLEEAPQCYSNRWVTTILFKEKALQESVKRSLENFGIESKNLWKPMHRQPVFSKCLSYQNGFADLLFDKGLCLPSGINLKEKDQDNIIDIVLSCLEKK